MSDENSPEDQQDMDAVGGAEGSTDPKLNESAEPAEASAVPDAQLPWWKRKAAWVVVVLVVVILIALVVAVSSRGSGDSASDLEGAQTSLPEPAQGSRDAVSSMEVEIDGDVAPVDFVQLTDQGTLLPPTDVSRLGWYSASAIPGEEGLVGSSVITGHINEVDQGEGFAAHFLDLTVGDTVTVIVNGKERAFEVSKDPVEVVKGAELPESVNDATGENRLVLITCGGEYVGGTLGYADNVIVEATPVA